ncbi:tripartite tricarboxylate transporter substrate binding protein [Elioraea sp.]|uniref:Bug family tripartite tricarboxylate transporter substrate binding protein n=1 Tax=Elioraea sp. TaxID=2185103 RepID=UPI0025BC5021|nr:tripartite tricarboxylate transporter substrate binding protein [Elioraea sp.]
MTLNRRNVLAAGLAAPTLAMPSIVRAQAWPTRPLTVIVPWAAGGGADTVTRMIAAGIEQEIRQTVNVVNRTGGNGVVGHSAIATAAADGHTIGTGTSEFVNFRLLGQADLGANSFDLISRISLIPAGVTVKADGPWRDFAAFAAALKEGRKGQYTGSGVGTGGAWHLAAAGMTKAMGLEADRIRWIPSQGGAPALQDLVAGGVSVFTGSPVEAKALADANQVRVAAVMGSERMAAYPNAPTLKELGIDWTFENWFAFLAPRNIPAPVRARLVEALEKAHARPEVRKAMTDRGIVPIWESSEAFASFASRTSDTAGGLLRDLGLVRS